jgi:hypothetical protein
MCKFFGHFAIGAQSSPNRTGATVRALCRPMQGKKARQWRAPAPDNPVLLVEAGDEGTAISLFLRVRVRKPLVYRLPNGDLVGVVQRRELPSSMLNRQQAEPI